MFASITNVASLSKNDKQGIVSDTLGSSTCVFHLVKWLTSESLSQLPKGRFRLKKADIGRKEDWGSAKSFYARFHLTSST
jgi:hypothetical protein